LSKRLLHILKNSFREGRSFLVEIPIEIPMASGKIFTIEQMIDTAVRCYRSDRRMDRHDKRRQAFHPMGAYAPDHRKPNMKSSLT
jgi:hypothetical protein